MNAETLLLTEGERKPILDAWVQDGEKRKRLSDSLCRAQAAKVLEVLLREARSEDYDEWHFILRVIADTGLTWPPKEG